MVMTRYIEIGPGDAASSGRWRLSIYADRVETASPECVNYFAGDLLIAQVDPTQLTIADSGGRTEEPT
jgi:hypothetical protein